MLPMMSTVPAELTDPVNEAILKVSEDQVHGFMPEPFDEIARLAGLPVETVLTRIAAMLQAGTIRRVRQTLMATNLAPGALVAWQLPDQPGVLDRAFNTMSQEDPFSGHIVIRSTDSVSAGSSYKLWTTLKVPEGYSRHKHCQYLASLVGALQFRIMPARRLFVLGVGHMRRRGLEVGSMNDQPAEPRDTTLAKLTEQDWRVLEALKREFTLEEITRHPWRGRAGEAGVTESEFLRIGASLNARGVIGRFSTFLEHVKPLKTGERVTQFNGLFHWAVPKGREIEAGMQVGRFRVLTHAYWREGGPEFREVNIMAVAHGTEKATVLAHKASIDAHLQAQGIPVLYTNVFWGGRSEIKPSEISPREYRAWLASGGIDEATMGV